MSKLTKPLFDEILSLIEGGAPLTHALDTLGVHPQQFARFMDRSPEASEAYARARQILLQRMADDIVRIQDEPPPARFPGGESPGEARTDSAWVQWQKNRVDARKWLLSKLQPKVYGERGALEVSGPDGGPVQTETRVEGLEAFRERLLKVVGGSDAERA